MKILLIALELHIWRYARQLTYCAQLGIEEGLEAHKIDYLTIPTPWLYKIRDFVGDEKYDQVWVELVHTKLDPDLLTWLEELAPVRVGFLLESLSYSPEEQEAAPQLKDRKALISERAKYMTHIIACDENDVFYLKEECHKPSLWWPQAVPSKFIANNTSEQTSNFATFNGSLYGQRAKLIKHGQLAQVLRHQPSPERFTFYPLLFNLLHLAVFTAKILRIPVNKKILLSYLNALRSIRRKCFALWLKSLQKGCATVNLPHFVKTYPGRVVEGMSAGVPVISWRIPERPKIKSLFKDQEEILLFDKEAPDQLAVHIKKLSSEPVYRQTLSQKALEKVKTYHTIEHRVKQILSWIETNEDPMYG